MTSLRKTSALVIAALALSATAASAEGYRFGWGGWGGSQTPGIDRTQSDQARQIARGERNGSLTARESADLRAEQARIAEMERRAKADGFVTREERERIRSAQSQAERHISQETHDREVAGNRGGWRRWW